MFQINRKETCIVFDKTKNLSHCDVVLKKQKGCKKFFQNDDDSDSILLLNII